jgi:hypothetical protein
MKTNLDIAHSLAALRYLGQSDVDIAINILENTMPFEAVDALAQATRDKTDQDHTLARAITTRDVDIEAGTWDDQVHQQEIIAEILVQKDDEFAMIIAAREKIVAAAENAAAVLADAGLIDVSVQEDVQVMIKNAWGQME